MLSPQATNTFFLNIPPYREFEWRGWLHTYVMVCLRHAIDYAITDIAGALQAGRRRRDGEGGGGSTPDEVAKELSADDRGESVGRKGRWTACSKHR